MTRVSRTLVITNDFPPRPGGIQAFVYGLVSRLSPDEVVVYAPSWGGADRHDASVPFPVVRHPGSLMLPGPGVARRARDIARAEGCDAVVYGAALPLGLLTPALRRAGVARFVALTHGHETGWAMLPVTRAGLRRVAGSVDVLTYLGEYTRGRIASALSGAAAARLARLAPGVDSARFAPGCGGGDARSRLGLGDRPVVVCVSRLVPRKGQDVLVRAWPRVLRVVPDAALLLVGGGPYRGRLERAVDEAGVRPSVWLTGSVPWSALPAYYDAGDVFAMPCRSRWDGLDTEGLGMVYLEASATGLPVVAGGAGGAPEAVLHGETGHVIDGRCPDAVAGSLITLLSDRERARTMGMRGRAWVTSEWRWDTSVARLRSLLTPSPSVSNHEGAIDE